MNQKFATNTLINLMLFFLLFQFSKVLAQDTEYLQGLLHVKFKKDAISKLNSKLSLDVLRDTELKNYLTEIGFKESRQVFSNVIENDTLGIDIEGKEFKKNDLSRWYLMSFNNKKDLNTVKEKILKYKDVEYVCPVSKWEISYEPDDPHFESGKQTGLKNGSTGRDIHATQAWNYNRGRSDVKIVFNKIF